MLKNWIQSFCKKEEEKYEAPHHTVLYRSQKDFCGIHSSNIGVPNVFYPSVELDREDCLIQLHSFFGS